MSIPAAPTARCAGAVVWEETACPLCGVSFEAPLITVCAHTEQAIYRVVRCRACGLGYLNPRPDPASIGQFYPDEYECYQPPVREHDGWWARQRRRLERLALARVCDYPPPLTRWSERLLAALATPLLARAMNSLTALPFVGEGKMLDFGCGSGWYAQRMCEQGWNVTGMDFSPRVAAEVTRRYGIPVHVGSLPHPEVPPESFDLITMGCVLEHVHRPHDVIAGAAAALRPGGRLVIVVPNIASWGFRHFGEDWWPLELPRHLLHFSPATLRRLVEAHDLEIVEERMLERGSWMRRSFSFARRRHWGSPVQRTLVGLSGLRLVPSLLTRWTLWRGQADAILIHARRPRQSRLRLLPPVSVVPAA